MSSSTVDAGLRECASLAAGLLAPQATIAPKYFYDALGARLFELITMLPEYYPTRTERAVMDAHGADMATAIGRCGTLIDLGAGNAEKARALFPVLAPQRYLAVDVAVDFVETALAAMRAQFPAIRMQAVAADLGTAFALPLDAAAPAPRLFFYPGSSIGNFDPDAAGEFLGRVRAHCQPGDSLLIGVDLVKDVPTLTAAYNDALGITAAFNLNVLRHVNAVLGSDFDPAQWRHRAYYDVEQGRIEMHLIADTPLAVRWPGGQRHFARGDTIHTENSYKYRPAEFSALLARAGFGQIRSWTDDKGWFGVFHARANGETNIGAAKSRAG